MIQIFRRLYRNSDATAAVEAAIFAPIFLTLTLGITDLGAGMFVRMTVNAATQAGAAYAVKHSCASTCLNGIKTAMNDATGNPAFCTGITGIVCTASMAPDPCPAVAGTVCVITVTANYPYSPILPDAVYSWATSTTVSFTTTIRIQ
jgi:Flp pilus assembly protein TadG